MLKRILNKAPYRIFLALFTIMLIAFTSCYIILSNSTSAINNQMRQNAKLTSKSMAKSFDESFKEVNNTIYAVNLLHYQVYEEDGHKGLNMSNIVHLLNDARQMISQDYIYDFVIHFSESSLAVTSQGTTDFDEFFNNTLKNIIYPPEFWKRFANIKHPMKIIPSVEYSETTLDNKTYNRNLIGVVGNNKMNNTKLSILVFIDENSLLERVNRQNMAEGSSLIVLDQDGNIILNTDSNFNSDILEDIHFGKTYEKSYNDGQYEYYCIKSSYNDFIYISKIPFAAKKMLPEMNISTVVFIVSFLFTAGVCVLLSFYLYAPVRRMFSLLKTGANGKLSENIDDACYEVKLLCNENRFYKSQMELVENDVRRSIFFKMIDDVTNYKKLKNQIDTYFKEIFCCQYYAMVGLKFEPGNGSDEKSKKSSGLLSGDFVNNIQKNLESIFDFPIVFYIENSMFIALIGLRESDDRKQVIGKIDDIMEEMKLIAGSGYAVTGALSRFYTEADDCNKAFKDIKACMAYRSLKSGSSIIDYEKLNSTNGMYFPAEQIDKLLNLIANGNSKESKAIVNHIIVENIKNDISYIKFTSIINSIFNSIINALEFENIKKEEIDKLEMDFFEKVDSIGNYRDMQRFLETVIDRITADISGKKQSKLNREFILEYINLHYAEDLYLESMAQMTETTPKYFSNFFKRTIGTNFVEYINKVRIQHAKELLKNTDTLVSDIGEKVGYANSSTFTITFKKYCGISPVEYRKDFSSK